MNLNRLRVTITTLRWYDYNFVFVHYTGPLQESAIWVDESQTTLSNLRHGRPQSPIFSKDEEDPLGISDEGNQ